VTARRLALFVVVGAGAAVAVYSLPVAEWTTQLAERARGTGAVGVVLFLIAYVVSTVAFLPGSILTLAAGFAYGPLWGIAIASPASVIGSTCAFLLGRTLLRGWAEARVGASARVRAIDAAVSREGFKIVFLLRLSPIIPFNALNYALSLSKVSVRTYVLASFLGMLPGTAFWVYLGSLAPAAAELSSAEEQGGTLRTILYVGGLAATAAAAFVGARAARRALNAELQEPTPS
jgi:uncharacterized membrane protein YdjX (TVP38/TMEM64 family)